MKMLCHCHPKGRQMKTMALSLLLMFGQAAMADDLPFWGEGSPSTNRNTVVSQATAVVQSFSTFVFSWHSFHMPKFDSRKNGFIIVFN